jgi:hypothetical protein
LSPTASDPVNDVLDALIDDVQATFHAFLLAQTTLRLGGGALANVQDNTLVGATLGVNLAIEPIPIGELRQYSDTFPSFLLEVFHGKTVQHWQDCLARIFEHYVALHCNGSRPFVELKSQEVRLDFASTEAMSEQMRFALVRSFEFREYGERQKLVDKIRNKKCQAMEDLQNIHKHVQIRNASQHRHGVIDAFALRKLGTTKIEVLDSAGQLRSLTEGERIELSVPEYDSFRRSILIVGQAWRQ